MCTWFKNSGGLWCWSGVVWVCVVLGGLGCASEPQRSTRLTDSDLDQVVLRVAESLRASELLAGRTGASPRMVVVVNRVQNLTDDVIPIDEQWMLVARLQGSLPVRGLADDKNVRFVIPPERVELLRGAGYDVDGGGASEPTHVMTATFLSARRSGRGGQRVTDVRSNYYYLEYALYGLDGRELLWTDRFEFKREAVGLVID